MVPTHIPTLLTLLLLSALTDSRTAGPKKQPTAAEVVSGKALNDLLGEVAAGHADGRRGPEVALDADVLQQINVAPPGGGNFGLLRQGGNLTWPAAFDAEKLRGNRETVSGLVLQAVQSLHQDPKKMIDKDVLAGLEGGIQRLGERLAEEVNEIPTGAYLEARRFLQDLADGVRALRHPQAGKFVDGTYAAKGKSVEELVEHLRGQKLQFAPAVGGQEAAYRTLYRALAAYHAGLK